MTDKDDGSLFVHISNIKPRPISWLVEGLIERNSLVVFFGAPEAGKSLLAIDAALCCAAGIDFHGRECIKGPVFYIAGEGFNGLSRRFAGWGKKNGVDINKLNFFLSKSSVPISDEHEVDLICEEVEKLESRYGKPVLIVIDTLARNFGSGNENEAKDINQFVNNIDKYLKIPNEAAVLIVHHSGHSTDNRAKGSIALKGALDSEFCVKKGNNNLVDFTCTKMKDAERPETMTFKIAPIDIFGGESTAVVELNMRDAVGSGQKKPSGANQTKALNILEKLKVQETEDQPECSAAGIGVAISEWKSECAKEKIDRKRFSEVKSGLLKKELISEKGGLVFIL